jgi:hypothetical protein
MGANAQTSVPLFVANTVLTAATQNISAATGIPVFSTTVTRDAAFGGSNKALAEGQFCYLESTNALQYYDGSAWAGVGAQISGATVATTQTTTSTSYTDLATSGPAVTLTTGTTAFVIVTTYSYNATSGTATYMSFGVSGATTIAAGDSTSVSLLGMKTGGQEWSNSAVYPVTLTAGSNTFTSKYKTSSGTGTFGNRSIIVIAP